ncbi:hypothetical protein GCM10022393_30830 [Aquimarina addita]|uniref:DUF2975 domain-containing protein n=1 Tax=Aquimarina addita TaxID=870485 RepID=A0ABP6UNH8_9FLAO
MRNVLKIGILIIGIVLILNALKDANGLILSLLKHLDQNSFGDAVYLYTKEPSSLKFVLSFIGLFLKMVIGLILLFKPSILNKFYIPNGYEETQYNLPILLIWSFIYCLGIYLIIDGTIDLMQTAVRYFQYTSKAKENIYFKNSFLSFIPEIIKIAIGYLMYKNFQKRIYSGEFKNEHNTM